MKNIFLFAFVASISMGQTHAQEDPSARFPHRFGNLLFDRNYADFSYLKDTEVRTDTLRIYNTLDIPLSISFEKPPVYLDCRVVPSTLQPSGEGMLLITYDAPRHGDYGFVNYRLGIRTNDPQIPMVSFPVRAYIEEDFSKLTDEERENPPAIAFDGEIHDFGTIKSGEKVSHDFIFRNNGKRDLIIRKTRATCGCTATQPEKTLLKPGEQSYVTVTFNSAGRSGAQNNSVFIYSNDPRHSTAAIHLRGQVQP